MRRTECNTKGRPSRDQVILRLVMESTEDSHQKVQEYPHAEEQSPPSLVDHPDIPLLRERLRDIGSNLHRGVCVGPLKTLKTSALGLVALEVNVLASE